jgi:hypothetical protein
MQYLNCPDNATRPHDEQPLPSTTGGTRPTPTNTATAPETIDDGGNGTHSHQFTRQEPQGNFT